jgi:hypothetical protein
MGGIRSWNHPELAARTSCVASGARSPGRDLKTVACVSPSGTGVASFV